MKLFPGVAVTAAVPAVAAVVVKRALDAKLATVNATHLPEIDALLDTPEELVTHATMTASDGASIHYVDTRPGADPSIPTAVLCHGITAQWYSWAPIIRLLAPSHRVIAWDMRGHGRSSSGTNGVTIQAAAQDLAELLDRLELTSAVVAGHSMGGMELCRFLVDHTSTAVARVKGALFVATSANATSGTRRTGGWARNSGAINKVLSVSGDRQVVLKPTNPFVVSFVAAGYGNGVTKAMVEAQLRMQNEMSPSSYRQGMDSIAQHNLETALRQRAEQLSSVEISVVSASLDRLTPPIHGKGIVSSLPHAAWHEVPGAGHNILFEQPQVIVDSLLKLLV